MEIDELIKRIRESAKSHYGLRLDGTETFDNSYEPERWEWIEFYQELIEDIIMELEILKGTKNGYKI